LTWSTELFASYFSPVFLAHHERKAKHLIRAQPPEAQWGDELNRCLIKATGGKCVVRSEFRFTAERKIDLFIPSGRWGRFQTGHEERFAKNGKYNKWELLTDHLILDFHLTTGLPSQ